MKPPGFLRHESSIQISSQNEPINIQNITMVDSFLEGRMFPTWSIHIKNMNAARDASYTT